MRATAVIGMNYGDEGKGHITNYFSDKDALVVRFNGGAQAAHSVFLSDGRSHVFHHFGSGSLRGARTLLTSHFIVNPIIFAKELWELSKKVPVREVFMDPRCRVTTPFDMAINEFNSKYRKKNNTCGVGINETVERSMYRQLKINIRTFVEGEESDLKKILLRIQNEYVPYRLEQLKIPRMEFDHFCDSVNGYPDAINAFLKVRRWMLERTMVMWPEDSLVDKFLEKDSKRHLVFEGAQGMLLDQRRKEFMPYLTRSSTGIRNVLELLKTVRTSLDLEAVLVSRSYLTRHGDGPVWNRCALPYKGITNTTNPYNEFQGHLRYGYLNKEWYDRAIAETKARLEKYKPGCLTSASVNVAMTCCDHINPGFKYTLKADSEILDGTIDDFHSIKYVSSGPTEKDVHAK